MTNGVKFDDKHSINDWDLLLIEREIGMPSPKKNEIEIPGTDSVLDLTEFFGQVNYDNRQLSFSFDSFSNVSEWPHLIENISKCIHGKKKKIILDIDPNFYYYGRCQIDNISNDFSVLHINIICDCEPYKYKLEKTVIECEVIKDKIYTFNNLDVTVIPEIIVSGSVNFEFEGNKFSLSEGTYKELDVSFKEGNNEITILDGSGTVTFSYQEATL